MTQLQLLTSIVVATLCIDFNFFMSLPTISCNLQEA